ncbi:MAG: methyl-accepting chemotaxis protein [Thiothrix lacustris]|uniref:Methyl-accepting chemotaxis protein n=1 Tax=Thiothrix lacustris TaxID=525917 RepID=A0A1Y1QFD3_9GAMM|nr:MAG: methyl-accepting chemotaxis protein [Thiothrix lacustris]
MLFQYPPQAAFMRVLPKNKIYEHSKPSAAVREQFVSQVDKIVWQYKLAPETVNLPARAGVPEIQIFAIAQKMPELSEAVLRCIDHAIPFPIIYHLTFDGRTQVKAAYKPPAAVDGGKGLVGEYLESAWQTDAAVVHAELPLALDLGGLYEQLLRRILPLPSRVGESLPAQLERLAQIRQMQAEYRKLEARLHQERQFNRKVALNTQLRRLRSQLEKSLAI